MSDDSDNRPNIDERLDRVADLLDTAVGQLARLSEQMTASQLEQQQRSAALDAKLDRLVEASTQQNQAIAALAHQAEQQTQAIAAIDARLDRIAATLESQNRALEGHIQLAQQQAQTVATLTTLVSQLLAART